MEMGNSAFTDGTIGCAPNKTKGMIKGMIFIPFVLFLRKIVKIIDFEDCAWYYNRKEQEGSRKDENQRFTEKRYAIIIV